MFPPILSGNLKPRKPSIHVFSISIKLKSHYARKEMNKINTFLVIKEKTIITSYLTQKKDLVNFKKIKFPKCRTWRAQFKEKIESSIPF